jgi:hypothetical protein
MAVNTKIQFRRGTTTQWENAAAELGQGILYQGEIGFDTTTKRFKIGDGTTSWSNLPYNSIGASNVLSGNKIAIGYAALGSGLTINVSGLTSSDISDFASAVNTLIDAATLDTEQIQDIIGNSGVIGGFGINKNYDDNTGLTTISATGLTAAVNPGSGIYITSSTSNNNTIYTVHLSDPSIQLSDITDLSANARGFLLTPSSNNLNTLVTDNTGTGQLVFADSPNLKNVTVSGTLDVLGDTTLNSNIYTTGNLTVGGNLYISGTTVTVNSTTVTIDDPVFTLGGDTAPSLDDNKDRGIEFRYHNGASAQLGFFGYDDSTGKFTFLTGATNSSEVFSGTKGEIDATVNWNNLSNIIDPVLTVQLSGNVAGTGTYTWTDLNGNPTISIATIIQPNSVDLTTDTVGNYVASITNGSYITGGNGGSEGAALTLNVDATSANTPNKVVARDGSGGFSAGLIIATGFSGNGSQITNINASNISTGTLNAARLPGVSPTYTNLSTGSTFVSGITIDSYGRVTSVASGTHTVATTSTLGIASFSSTNFGVTAGAVSIKASGISNTNLINSSFTIGQSTISLGDTANGLSGVSAANPVVLTYFAIDGGSP